MNNIRIRPIRTSADAPPPGRTPLQVPPGLIYRELSRVVVLVAGLFLIYRLAGPISAILLLFWTALFVIVLQQVESHLLTPMVLGGKLELHPVSVVFAILVMHTLFGLLGALLAVPVCAMIKRGAALDLLQSDLRAAVRQ